MNNDGALLSGDLMSITGEVLDRRRTDTSKRADRQHWMVRVSLRVLEVRPAAELSVTAEAIDAMIKPAFTGQNLGSALLRDVLCVLRGQPALEL